MSLSVLLLVVVSASIHVFWNALVKTSRDKRSFAFLTTLMGGVVFLPVFVAGRFSSPGPLGYDAVLLALLSGLFEALYTIFLFNAYRFADLSVVYPISRGIAPLATLVAGELLLGDTISWAGAVGVAMVVFGVFVIGRTLRTGSVAQASRAGIFLSLATGCMIAGYHLVDRRAMMLAHPPHPWEYMFLMQFFLAVFVSVWAVAGKGSAGLLSEWSRNRKSVILVGLMAPAAYFLIIAALKYGNVTYVAAGRNVGIVISTIVGFFFLKETLSRHRIMGSVFIAAGVAVMVMFP